MSARRAAFVDRDGTINELVADPETGRPESPLSPADVVLIDRVPEALTALARVGWLIVGVSNQPAAAKGKVSLEQLAATQARVEQLLAAHGVRFDQFRLCHHHPDGIVPALSGECECRKPAPGMLLAAARELGIDLRSSWMIGDSGADVDAGRAAGARTVLIVHEPSAHRRAGLEKPDLVAPDLEAAVDLVLRTEGVR